MRCIRRAVVLTPCNALLVQHVAASDRMPTLINAERVDSSVYQESLLYKASHLATPLTDEEIKNKRYFRFPARSGDHYKEKGLTPDAKRLVAEAEEEYLSSLEALTSRPGGPMLAAEPRTEIDEEGNTIQVRRLAMPFGETYVPSTKERFSVRGQVGQLSNTRSDKWLDVRKDSDHSLLMSNKVDEVLDSKMLSTAKAEECTKLIGEVIRLKLSLRPSTWEGVFASWALDQTQPLLENYSKQRNQLQVTDTVDRQAIASNLNRYSDLMRSTYLYLRSTFTAPTPSIMEHVMRSLALSGRNDKRTFHFANRILLDADKYVCLPTRTTYASFFDVCNKCEKMDFAVSRYADALDRLHIEPDCGMATSLLKGLNENGLVEEAVAFLSRMERIDADILFINTSLETLLLSDDPRALFSVYDSISEANLIPSSETFALLLLACERIGDWGPTTRLLSDMQRFKVRGSSQCLNLFLKGLLQQKLRSYAEQLYVTMKTKGVEVWPSLEDAMSAKIRLIGASPQLSASERKQWLKANKRHSGGSAALTRNLVEGARRRIDGQQNEAAEALLHDERPNDWINESTVSDRRSDEVDVDLDEEEDISPPPLTRRVPSPQYNH